MAVVSRSNKFLAIKAVVTPFPSLPGSYIRVIRDVTDVTSYTIEGQSQINVTPRLQSIVTIPYRQVDRLGVRYGKTSRLVV